MNAKHEKTNKKIPSLLIMGFLLLLACGICFGGFTAARYVLDRASGNQLASADRFYFTSDYLEEGDYPVYHISVPSWDEAAIQFQLRNYADEKRVSETDISYQCAVTVNGASDEDKAKTGALTLANNTPSQQEASVTIKDFNKDDFQSGKATVQVTATASPYAQTIGAIFELYLPIQGVEYSVSDAVGSNTLILLVTTGEKGGTVTIQYNQGNQSNVLPDNTNPLLKNITATSCTFQAEADAQYSFVFFKTDPKQIYVSDFTVE